MKMSELLFIVFMNMLGIFILSTTTNDYLVVVCIGILTLLIGWEFFKADKKEKLEEQERKEQDDKKKVRR